MYGQHHNSKVQVLDFILTQTGTYQEQALRPFATHIQAHHANALQTATNGGHDLGVGAVQAIASEIIRPEANIEGVAAISEGWNSRRFRFLMRVEERHAFNPHERTQRVYFGYTDHCDASFNHLDPQMRIYFNSETIVKDIMRQTPNGPQMEPMIVSANQIISPIDMSGPTRSAFHTAPTTFMIRPEDIFNRGQSMHMAQKMQSSGMMDSIDMQLDTRAMVGQGGGFKYSRRRDTTPTRYLSDTLNAYNHAQKEAQMQEEFDHGMDRDLLFGAARTHVANQDISSNAFFALLKDMAGFMEKGFVTMSELTSIFPETNPQHGVTKYSMDNGQSMRRINLAHDSEHWRGSDHVTIAATTLAQVVPAIMMDNFIRTISFAATNGHGLGDFAIEIHAEGLRGVVDGLRLTAHLQEFERRLILDALKPLTHDNQVGFQISMASDLAGDSVIDIAIHGEPLRRYVAPTFTDSLFTPVVTHEHQRQDHIASDLVFLLESALPVRTPGQMMAQPVIQGAPNYNPTPVTPVTPPYSHQGTSNDGYSGLL